MGAAIIIRTETPRGFWRSRWAAIGAAVAVTLGGGGLFIADAATGVPSSVVTIDPVRILDTRDPVNIGLPGPFVSPVSQKLQVTGAAVPAGATGVLLNVTVVSPTADGFLAVRPGDATGAPGTSSLNFNAGQTVPNAVQVGLPTTGPNAGQIDITYDAYGATGPTTDVLIDAVGYLVAGSAGPGGPAGPAGPQGPAGPHTELPPVGRFTPTQIVKDAILTCSSVSGDGKTCNNPSLNGMSMSNDFPAGLDTAILLCSTLVGSDWQSVSATPPGVAAPSFKWNGSTWSLTTTGNWILSIQCK